MAPSVQAGLERLQREPVRVGIVVIDGDLLGAMRMAREAKAACPVARVIVLSGPRGPGEVSSLLVEGGLD
jgi:hypothetical protein